MSYPPYKEYNDSGVDWLGKIPRHWETKRLKYLSTCNDDVIPENTSDDEEIVYVDISSVNLVEGIHTKEILSFGDAPSRARRIVKDGDIIVSTVRTYLKAIAIVVNPENNLIVSTGFAVVRPAAQFDSKFAGYFFTSNYFIDQVISRSNGVSYPAINAIELIRISIFSPPIFEQKQIAIFLDRETQKIDALVEEQQDLIELLQEKRLAMISQAVTKGLDSSVPMKSSEIDWLGDIPEHWDLKRLRFVNQLNPSKKEIDTDEENPMVSFLPMDSIGDDGSLILDQNKSLNEVNGSGYTYFRDLDITIAKITPCFENGKGALMQGLTNGIGFGTTELIVVRPNEKQLYPHFLEYLFNTSFFRLFGESEMYGAGGQKRVPDRFIKNYLTGIPPLEEQTQIATFLDRETQKIDNMIEHANKNISLLTERRSAIISSAVTGKIDVCDQVEVIGA
jgi:type I restriction enzyme, S subunit